MNAHGKSKSDGNVFKNMFVGMDIHKNYLQIAIMDNKGKLMRNDRIDNNLDEIHRFFSNNDVEQNNSHKWLWNHHVLGTVYINI